MGSLRDWHDLTPDERHAAECIHVAHQEMEMEVYVSSVMRFKDVVVHRSLHGDWFIWAIPSEASSQAAERVEPGRGEPFYTPTDPAA